MKTRLSWEGSELDDFKCIDKNIKEFDTLEKDTNTKKVIMEIKYDCLKNQFNKEILA